jgi:hypothetical protein
MDLDGPCYLRPLEADMQLTRAVRIRLVRPMRSINVEKTWGRRRVEMPRVVTSRNHDDLGQPCPWFSLVCFCPCRYLLLVHVYYELCLQIPTVYTCCSSYRDLLRPSSHGSTIERTT